MLRGLAIDIKGNRSAPDVTQVTVLSPAVHAGNSTFLPESNAHPADGKTTQTLSLQDHNNQPVYFVGSDFTIKRLKSASAVVCNTGSKI